MMSWLDLGIFLGALVVAGLAVHLVHKHWSHEKRRKHTDVAGFIFAGVAVLYAVMLAFVVIVSWEDLGSARTTTYSEADQLANVYWISRDLPPPQGPAIAGLTVAYAHTVIGTEWPLMNQGETSLRAQVILNQIRDRVFAFQPRTGQQQGLYEQALADVNGLSAARRDRLASMNDTVPEPLWVALIAGGVITVAFCLLFGVENQAVYIAMVAGIAALITISLLLVKDMQYPFAGDPHIGPEAFKVFLDDVQLR
jgi:tartrate dehydratase beta subunit/fumarate hydratase class I family protein